MTEEYYFCGNLSKINKFVHMQALQLFFTMCTVVPENIHTSTKGGYFVCIFSQLEFQISFILSLSLCCRCKQGRGREAKKCEKEGEGMSALRSRVFASYPTIFISR